MISADLDHFFEGYPDSRPLFEAVCAALETIGPTQVKVGLSQIAFHRRKAFAWVWIPGRYLRGRPAPLVLTFSFRFRDPSPRWKQIVEPRPGRFTHHLELHAASEVDDEVAGWLKGAWEEAA